MLLVLTRRACSAAACASGFAEAPRVLRAFVRSVVSSSTAFSSSDEGKSASSSTLAPVDLDTLAQRHGLIAEALAEAAAATAAAPSSSSAAASAATSAAAAAALRAEVPGWSVAPPRGGKAWLADAADAADAAAATISGADADALFEDDPELAARLARVGAAPLRGDGASTSVTGGDELMLEPMPWPPPRQHQQQHQQHDHLAAASNATGTTKRAALAAVQAADPWEPPPPDSALRARLPAAVAALLCEFGGGGGGGEGGLGGGSGGGFTAAAGAAAADAAAANPAAMYERLQRAPVERLRAALDGAGVPSYGRKDALLRRAVRELAKLSAAAAAAGEATEGGFGDGDNDAPIWGALATTNSVTDEEGEAEAPSSSAPHHPAAGRVRGEARARVALLAAAADAREACRWLLEARAGDVTLIDVRGRAGATDAVVVATGASARHARACAEAVRWRLLQKAAAVADATPHDATTTSSGSKGSSEGSLQRPSPSPPPQQPPRLRVSGSAESEWLALEAGRVAVHVLTQRARRYYGLEALWGAPGRVARARLRRGEGGDGGGVPMTKDTITAE